ncbi:MAG: DUF2779 domain-containing protein, partial [Minisyncoccia bacterium]
VKLGYKNDGVFSGTMYYGLPDETKKLLEKNTRVILQGRLEVDNITSIFDVLERTGDNTYNLFEIKSSTTVKPEHIPDLAFQTIVLEKAGLKIENIYVLHVNNEYVRHGDIEPLEISKKTEVTDEVREIIDETLYNIGKAFEVLAKKEMPDISPRHLKGALGEWLEILELVQGEVDKYSIYNLTRITPKKIGELEDMGVSLIGDIPSEFELAETQERQVTATRTGVRKVDQEEIKSFLDALEFPLHFFDYETVMSVIPIFEGTKPYQQIPFQYSLNIEDLPGGELRHKEYLHTTHSDPVPALLKQMKEDFEGRGSVISWNKKFEMTRNDEMGKLYPEYAKFLRNINDRMVDLMDPFIKGWFVDKDFIGSASIKRVLPVLVPELSYKELEVSHGGMAQRVWMQTMLKGKNIDSKDEIIGHLKKYCALDTYAMYAIYKYLLETI